jgi:FG-GAP repeat
MNWTRATCARAVGALALASVTSSWGCAPDRDASRASHSPDRERTARVAQPLAWFETELTPLDGTPSDRYGWSVAVSGNTAIVGAPDANSAYVFVRSNSWQQQAKLVLIGATRYDYFGLSVAISGDTAIVGTPNVTGPNGTYQGAAFVFVRSGTLWAGPVTLTANDGAAEDRFGFSVAISEGRAIVGAPNASDAQPRQGAAYVFTQSGADWNQTKLAASDGLPGDNFGRSVAISGTSALVGAPRPSGDSEGAAYVFTDSGAGWDEQKHVASDAFAGDGFGSSVAIDGDMAVVGAPFARGKSAPNGHRQGAAYVFVSSALGWTRQGDVLFADDAMDSDEFGTSVAVSGSTATVGAPLVDSVYVFAPLTSAAVQQLLGGRGSYRFFGY